MKWLEALKEWNKTQPKWKIPKKGTSGYLEVKKLMDGGATKKARKGRPKKVKSVDVLTDIVKQFDEKPKRKRGRPKKMA